MSILDSIGKEIIYEKTCEWQIIIDKDNYHELQQMLLGETEDGRIPLNFFDCHHTKTPVGFNQTVFAILTCVKGSLYRLFEVVYDKHLSVFRAYEEDFELDRALDRAIIECERVKSDIDIKSISKKMWTALAAGTIDE